MALTPNVKPWVTVGGIGTLQNIVGTASFPNSYTTSSSGTYTYATTASASITDDITITRPGKPPMKVAETLETILERLLIIEADFQKMEKYPALKEAYDNYKLIEALVSGEDNEDAV